jgi:hypothetical protein
MRFTLILYLGSVQETKMRNCRTRALFFKHKLYLEILHVLVHVSANIVVSTKWHFYSDTGGSRGACRYAEVRRCIIQ